MINKQIASVFKCFSAVAFPCVLIQVNPIKTLPIFLLGTVEDELQMKWMKSYLTKIMTMVSGCVFPVSLSCKVVEMEILKRLISN